MKRRTHDPRCNDEWLGVRCGRLEGHPGFHSGGGRTWAFRNEPPEWVARARAHLLPTKALVL